MPTSVLWTRRRSTIPPRSKHALTCEQDSGNAKSHSPSSRERRSLRCPTHGGSVACVPPRAVHYQVAAMLKVERAQGPVRGLATNLV